MSSSHTKHYALVGLFRFALQRGLLSTSPLPYFVPKRPEYAKPYIYSTDELAADPERVKDTRRSESQDRPSREHPTADVSNAHPGPLRRGAASQRGAGADGR